MKKLQNSKKNSLYKAHTQTKRVLVIVLLGFFLLFLIGTVSAMDWDNVKSYNEETRTVTVINALNLPLIRYDIAKIQLITPLEYKVPRGYQKVAEFELYDFEKDYNNAFKDMNFYQINNNSEEFERDFDYKYLDYVNEEQAIYGEVCENKYVNGTSQEVCETKEIDKEIVQVPVWIKFNDVNELPSNQDSFTIGIFTIVEKGDKVEWIPTFFGVKINEWAIWKESLDVGLVSYYPLNETSGVVLDVHGNNDGTNVGATRGVAGKIGNAFDFERSESDYLNPNMNWNGGTTDFTFTFWYKPESLTDEQTLISTDNGTVPRGFQFLSRPTELVLYDGNSEFINTTGNPLTIGNWHHVAITHNGTIGKIYVDGVMNKSGTSNFNDVSYGLIFAQRSVGTPTAYADGIWDEIGVWNRSLTAPEISELWNSGDGLSYFNRIAPPEITLNFPIDNFNSTNQTIVFNGTVSDNVNLINVSLYIDGVLNETNSSGINNTDYIFTKILLEGNYNWTYKACNNESKCETAVVRNFTVASFLVDSITYNSSSYETAQETISMNITTNGSTFLIPKLIYDGLIYSATGTNIGGNNYTLLSTIDIPLGVENKSFYFNFTIGGNAKNTDSYQQNISLTNFTHCTVGTLFMNISFKNETILEEPITAAISSTWNYWLGSGTVSKALSFSNVSENPYYGFCLIGINRTLGTNVSLIYSNNISQQRNFIGSFSLTNVTTNQTLYLLPTTEGLYVTFQVISVSEQPISGVFSNVTKAGVLISSGTTDDAGTISYFLNPDSSYTFTFFKGGYDIYITTLTPTQTTFTIILGAEEVIEEDDYTRGITYSVSPGAVSLVNGTNTYFNFTLTSTYWDVEEFGFNLTNQDGTLLDSTSASTNGGTVFIFHNTSNDTTITMTFFWTIEGNISIGSTFWTVVDSSGRGFGLTTFFTHLTAYLDTEMFGLNSNSMVILIYIVIFIAIGIMSFKYGITSPAAISLMIFGLVFLFEIHLEWIPSISGFPILTILFAIVSIALILKEELR